MTPEAYKITIRYGHQYGYISFDPITHSIKVQFDHAGKRSEVENYLSTEQVIPVSTGDISHFADAKLFANTGLTEFKAVLTRLWNVTDVAVEWSRPVL